MPGQRQLTWAAALRSRLVTKSVTVTYDDHLFWAYDQALSLLLKYVIDVAEERGLDEDQRWPRRWHCSGERRGSRTSG